MQNPAQLDWFKTSIIALLILIATNLVYLDWKILGSAEKPEQKTVVGIEAESVDTNSEVVAAGCDEKCLEEITKEVAKVVGKLPTPKPAETTKTVTIKETSKTGTTYIPLNGTFSTVVTSWTDVPSSDVYIKAEDYGKSPYISFEASIKSSHANGGVSARLYDATHGIAVDGSELSSTSQTATSVSSGNLPFWAGNNLYRVQIKSGDGQEVTFSSGRVKIVSK